MQVTIFTGNQPRHLALIKEMAKIAEKVYVIQECRTVLPGLVKDFYNNSETMREYFSYVTESEKKVFGSLGYLPSNCYVMGLYSGDVSFIPMEIFGEALQSDVYLVFGASYIKGPLIDFLIEHKALNIHMGVSPYYRGSSCNFWAIYDGHPELVGASIHLLSRGLDSGDLLYHAFPGDITDSPFDLGMLAVKAAFVSLLHVLETNAIENMNAVKQNKSVEIRYCKNQDFTDEVARRYLDDLPAGIKIRESLRNRDLSKFVNPFVMENL